MLTCIILAGQLVCAPQDPCASVRRDYEYYQSLTRQAIAVGGYDDAMKRSYNAAEDRFYACLKDNDR